MAQLYTHGTSVKDIAKNLDVTLRTVYRLLELAKESGLIDAVASDQPSVITLRDQQKENALSRRFTLRRSVVLNIPGEFLGREGFDASMDAALKAILGRTAAEVLVNRLNNGGVVGLGGGGTAYKVALSVHTILSHLERVYEGITILSLAGGLPFQQYDPSGPQPGLQLPAADLTASAMGAALNEGGGMWGDSAKVYFVTELPYSRSKKDAEQALSLISERIEGICMDARNSTPLRDSVSFIGIGGVSKETHGFLFEEGVRWWSDELQDLLLKMNSYEGEVRQLVKEASGNNMEHYRPVFMTLNRLYIARPEPQISESIHEPLDRLENVLDEINDYAVGIDIQQSTKWFNARMTAAGGAHKHYAILGALQRQLVDELITDVDTADFLLATAPQP